ncbi:MAG: hypoxanthine phosphoribosyltransferase [Ruminococcaceae bacterium]|nr:hypoxanthine phosphoribosyltransferase [Oscillospiraceae bacterium]
MIDPRQDIDHILFTEEQLDGIVTSLADRINRDYAPSPNAIRSYKLIVVAVMKGSVFFYTDLIKKLNMPVELDFVKVSSYYAGTVSSGQLKIHLDLKRDDYENIDILLVEDIVDSGRTLASLTENLRGRGAHSVRTVTLLDKPSRREVNYKADYTGAEIPDEFVVGYGLDFDEKYRDLPYIGVLKSEVYTK